MPTFNFIIHKSKRVAQKAQYVSELTKLIHIAHKDSGILIVVGIFKRKYIRLHQHWCKEQTCSIFVA